MNRLRTIGTASWVFLLVLGTVTSNNTTAQEPPQQTVPSELRDGAGFFSAEAVKSAKETLGTLARTTGVPVLIESIPSLEGEPIDTVAARLAKRSGTEGVFILLARRESKIEVLPSRLYARSVPRPSRDRIRQAFIDEFRKSNFDAGLRQGLAIMSEEFAKAKSSGQVPPAERPEPDTKPHEPPSSLEAGLPVIQPRTEPSHERSNGNGGADAQNPLIQRGEIRLTLAGARVIIEAASKQAESLKIRENIVVVDSGGQLISLDRMEGARPGSVATAITKAMSAAAFRQPTGPVPQGAANPDLRLDVGLQLAAQAGGEKFTTLEGGVPIIVDGQVIGAVGVGGATGAQDAEVARTGIHAFLQLLETRSEKPTPAPAP